MPYFIAGMQLVQEFARKCNLDIKMIPICAATDEGAELFTNWLKDKVKAWKGNNHY